jgi:hypothetical protein
MLFIVAGILLALWLVGLATSYTLGGLIHLLLVLSMAVLMIRLLQGTPPG